MTRNGSGKDVNSNNVVIDIPLAMDHFQYNYYNDFSNTGTTLTNPEHVNRLASVDDEQLTDSYTTDINPGQVANNYQYDKSGQLIKDIQEGIEKIEWTVSGKVKRITFTTASNKKELKFVYDPMDMRIAKIEYLNNDHSSINYEYYNYDVQGNVIATYERVQNLQEDQLKLVGHHIYGAKRLGVQNSGKELKQRNVVSVPQGGSIDVELSEDIVWGSVQSTSYDKSQRIIGDKRYELSNHLGNVLVVVSDRKIALNPTTYTANVVSYSDYSPYGVQLDQRHGDAIEGKYKYGYQGSEKDDEIKGEGNSYTTEFRQLDPRLGRWMSLDPVFQPWQSPYCSMNNNPILYNDIHGDISDKQEREHRRELRKMNRNFKELEKKEKKWAKQTAKKVDGTVIKNEFIIDEEHTTYSYTVGYVIDDEDFGEIPGVICNTEIGKERFKVKSIHNKIRNLVDGYFYNEGEIIGLAVSIGYDAYVGGGISGSLDLVYVGNEMTIGGTFGGGIGFGGGAGVDVGLIIATQSGRYRAKSLQKGKGWEFSVGIGPLNYSRSGDRETNEFYWNGSSNTTTSFDVTGALEKANYINIYKAIALKSLNSLKCQPEVKYEWNKSSVWGNY